MDARDKLGKTALAHATIKGHTACASLLMDRAARVDTADSDGNSVIHLASAKAGKSLVTSLT